MKRVVVTVHGGIAEVIEKPEDVMVLIRDYDVETLSEEELAERGASRDECGAPYLESEW